ncbi:putative ribonuclease H-like domain-containing protein [Tanacetum coccineum]
MAFDLRPTEDVLPWPGNANMAFDLRPTEDVLPWPGNANMAFDLRPTEDVLPWPGNANMAFDLRPTEDVLPWSGNANMAFDLRPTETTSVADERPYFPCRDNANMAFDLRPTEDVLPWPGNANMAFDLRPTKDVLPWPGNANMAFELRSTEDVLPWPGNANMAFHLRPTEDVLSWSERISAALVIETCRVDKGSAAHDVSHCEVNFQMQERKATQSLLYDQICELNQQTLTYASYAPIWSYNVKSLMKKSYYLVIIDDFSRFSWVFFLATKDETSGILKTFITKIENQLDRKVKVIRCDNGTEFKNSVMNQFCKMKGIKREFSVARTPQQNGVVERRNRTLIEAARTMLVDFKLPTTFWAEVVNTTCYVLNRGYKTPYELIRGRTPLIDFIKPFGCPVTILNTRD